MSNHRKSGTTHLLTWGLALTVILVTGSPALPAQHKTTVSDQEVTCAVCGETSTFPVLNSTNSMGYADLDTRPPEMQRSTMPMWVQRCPGCGYCSSDISYADKGVKEIVESDEYQTQLSDPAFPELADTFLCKAIIDEAQESHSLAGWDCLHAAWVCDDAGSESASTCRLRAIGFFQTGMEEQQEIFEDPEPGAVYAFLADILRRAGAFDRARDACQAGLEEEPEGMTADLINFQLALINNSDSACHTLEEVLQPEDTARHHTKGSSL